MCALVTGVQTCALPILMGVAAGCVHSKRAGRDQTIEDFKSGKIRALVNNNVLTTGFDFPGIDFIIILRATGSVVLWVQMLGRGTRPVYGLDGKEIGRASCRERVCQYV